MSRKYIRISLLISCIIIFAFSSCRIEPDRRPIMKDGRECGVVDGIFGHRWWNYYERALSFADCEFWQEAEADLRDAIKDRENDERRARTYGHHYIDYFPHRELGVVFFHQAQDLHRSGTTCEGTEKTCEVIDRLEEAIRQLKTSLYKSATAAMEPDYRVKSTKAMVYLSRARKLLFSVRYPDKPFPEIITGRLEDVTMAPGPQLPDIQIWDLLNEQLTYMDHVFIEGTVTGSNKIRELEINVNGKSFSAVPDESQLYFNFWASLQPGENTITISGSDRTDKRTTKSLKFVREELKPAMTEAGLRLVSNRFERTIISRKSEYALSSHFEDILTEGVSTHHRFSAVSRNILAIALKQLGLSEDQLEGNDKAIRKLSQDGNPIADCIIFGRILERKNEIEIFTRLVDIETTLVLAEADIWEEDLENNSKGTLQTAALKMNLEFANQLPILGGYIATIATDSIGVSFEWQRQAQVGMKLLPDEQIPDNAISRTKSTGLGRIITTSDRLSNIQLAEEIKGSDFKIGQKVRTR